MLCADGNPCGGMCRLNEFAIDCKQESYGLSYFVIPLTVFTTLYLMIGVMTQSAQGQSGWRRIPNMELWSSLCGFVADGVRFSCCIPQRGKDGVWVARRVFDEYERL